MLWGRIWLRFGFSLRSELVSGLGSDLGSGSRYLWVGFGVGLRAWLGVSLGIDLGSDLGWIFAWSHPCRPLSSFLIASHDAGSCGRGRGCSSARRRSGTRLRPTSSTRLHGSTSRGYWILVECACKSLRSVDVRCSGGEPKSERGRSLRTEKRARLLGRLR